MRTTQLEWARTAALGALLLLYGWNCSARAATRADDDWSAHGRDAAEQRFSTLTEINTGTVDRLGLVWSLDLPGESALEATPLEVAGVLYFPGGMGKVYAVAVATGALLWTYDSHEVETDSMAAARIFGVNRGVAYWENTIYFATRDGRMIALDAKTGRPVWITKFLLPDTKATSSGAPRVFKGKVIIGNSGAEFSARGYLTTMDARTGKVLWRFFTVPGDPSKGFEDDTMAMAAKTWSGEWWKYGGGGTPWNGITFDEELDQIYVGTGNGGPWNCRFRSEPGKDNLFLASVVALDSNSGKYKWHYQYNPRECWDWKATADIISANLKIDGATRKVLMHAPSNGFLYVIDRRDGKLISAEKLGKANWAERIDLATGRPVEVPGIRYENGPFTLYPGPFGAHNWQASAFNPNTGLIYIPYAQMGAIYQAGPLDVALVDSELGKHRYRMGASISPYTDPNEPLDGRGSLLAWDPVRQQLRWRVDHEDAWSGGAVTTAGGLVFQGTYPGHLYAYDAANGKQLWSYNVKLGIISPPITYSFHGRQYLSLLVGAGGSATEGAWPHMNRGWKFGVHPRRLLTFALDGKAQLPQTPPPDFSRNAVDDPALVLDPERVQRGFVRYHQGCGFCHGIGLDAVGGAPDLRESRLALNRDAFRAVVHNGALMSRGMPKFADFSDEDVGDIYQYIRQEARKLLSPRTSASK